MINVIEDLGKIYHGNSKQRKHCLLVSYDICKAEKIVPKSRLKNKDRYLCKLCSSKINLKLATEKNKEKYYEINKDEEYMLHKKEVVRKCRRECSKRYKENHPDRIKNTYYKRTYNLSLEEFNKMSKNGCYICGSREKLCVDHCHETGNIRGIL